MNRDSDLRFHVTETDPRYKKYAEALEWWINKSETLSKLLPTLLVEFAKHELNLTQVALGGAPFVPNTTLKPTVTTQSIPLESEVIQEFLPKEPPTDGQYIINEPGTYCSIHEEEKLRQILRLDNSLHEEFCQRCEPKKLGEVIKHVVKFTKNARVPAVSKDLHPRSQAEREAHIARGD